MRTVGHSAGVGCGWLFPDWLEVSPGCVVAAAGVLLPEIAGVIPVGVLFLFGCVVCAWLEGSLAKWPADDEVARGAVPPPCASVGNIPERKKTIPITAAIALSVLKAIRR